MFLFFPKQTDVLFPRFPVMNVVLMTLIIIVSFMAFSGMLPVDAIEALVLDGWGPVGLIGHMFLHADFWHLLGNMLFLWVFGNAICTKMNDIGYLLLILSGGLIAALSHNLFDGGPAVGASGAINCIVGFYLVVYPINKIDMWYGILWLLPPIAKAGIFRIPGVVLILFWFIRDIWGAISGGGNVAYLAHLGGFAWGLIIGIIVVAAGGIEMTRHDHSTLVDLFTGKKRQGPVKKKTYHNPDLNKVYTVTID